MLLLRMKPMPVVHAAFGGIYTGGQQAPMLDYSDPNQFPGGQLFSGAAQSGTPGVTGPTVQDVLRGLQGFNPAVSGGVSAGLMGIGQAPLSGTAQTTLDELLRTGAPTNTAAIGEAARSAAGRSFTDFLNQANEEFGSLGLGSSSARSAALARESANLNQAVGEDILRAGVSAQEAASGRRLAALNPALAARQLGLSAYSTLGNLEGQATGQRLAGLTGAGNLALGGAQLATQRELAGAVPTPSNFLATTGSGMVNPAFARPPAAASFSYGGGGAPAPQYGRVGTWGGGGAPSAPAASTRPTFQDFVRTFGASAGSRDVSTGDPGTIAFNRGLYSLGGTQNALAAYNAQYHGAHGGSVITPELLEEFKNIAAMHSGYDLAYLISTALGKNVRLVAPAPAGIPRGGELVPGGNYGDFMYNGQILNPLGAKQLPVAEAHGGNVPGPDMHVDTVPAMLRGGELVVTPELADKIRKSTESDAKIVHELKLLAMKPLDRGPVAHAQGGGYLADPLTARSQLPDLIAALQESEGTPIVGRAPTGAEFTASLVNNVPKFTLGPGPVFGGAVAGAGEPIPGLLGSAARGTFSMPMRSEDLINSLDAVENDPEREHLRIMRATTEARLGDIEAAAFREARSGNKDAAALLNAQAAQMSGQIANITGTLAAREATTTRAKTEIQDALIREAGQEVAAQRQIEAQKATAERQIDAALITARERRLSTVEGALSWAEEVLANPKASPDEKVAAAKVQSRIQDANFQKLLGTFLQSQGALSKLNSNDPRILQAQQLFVAYAKRVGIPLTMTDAGVILGALNDISPPVGNDLVEKYVGEAKAKRSIQGELAGMVGAALGVGGEQ